MLVPKLLKKGDIVGVIAPSDSIEDKDKKYIDESIRLMYNLGLKVEIGKNAYSNTTGYGASPEEKVEDIHYMFEKKEISAIFCAKGGENSNSLFDYLDYKLIRNNPKILCGFSDSTSILNVISDKTDMVTYNGPTFKSLTSWETDYAYKEVVKRFIQGNLEFGTENDEYKIIKEGRANGKLIGGNLSLMFGMICGKYALNFKDKILFMEELGYESNPTKISNNLFYLKQNGVFNEIKGIWVGNYEHESGIALEKILLDVIGNEYNFPIIKSNNFGHTDKKTVIPIGQKVEINTKNSKKIICLE